jgi:cell division protein FtsI/penicillin-binding protein 2
MKHVTNVRTKFLTIAGCLLFAIVVIRLVDLQVFKHSHFEAIAEAQRKRASDLLPHRGTIYVQEGKGGDIFPIASNKKAWIAYAVPRNMKDPKSVADTLAPALSAFRDRQDAKTKNIISQTGQNLLDSFVPIVSPEVSPSVSPEITPSPDDRARVMASTLFTRFDQRTDPYEPLLKPYEVIDDEFLAFLEGKKLEGIVLEEQEIRTYPEGSLAAHAVGYVGFDDSKRVGRSGVEGFFDSTLRGDFGFLSGERDASGHLIGVAANEFRAAEDGADVVLTLDRVVQTFAEQELRAGVERYRAERGSVLVMNPKTGAILAMATYPTFDPNAYYAVRDGRVQTNPIVSDSFEPGSILKPVVMAGAINDGLVTPETTFVDNGPVQVSKFVINTFDGKHLGVQTMTQALEQSNNIGMVWVAQKMGAQRMYDYLRRFGLGERTGVELDGETQTNVREPHKWSVATLATTGFGQGIVVTPLQALDAINVIANGGVLTQPHIVQATKKGSGEEKVTTPVNVRQVISKETADTVSAMMVSVIENGVAKLAQVPGYYLAGKTGTAQVADDTGKYSADKKIITFVGFGPVPDPEFSILIKLDNPYGLSFASGTAAPMFQNLAEKLLTYYQVPPSYDVSEKQKKFVVP